MISEKLLIKKCKQADASAQRILYERYSGKMMLVCLRYASCREDAEDIFQEAFIKVLNNIKNFKAIGSFEGWMRKIFIHHAINHYRNLKSASFVFDENVLIIDENIPEIEVDESDISLENLTQMIQSLPEGYRMVFNMYVIDGLTHQEIADQLKISVGTSKSQLHKARQILKEKVISFRKKNTKIKTYAR